ncbi:MAG TPA: glycerol-3-phosphate 1-O-acyltransferase PlsY [Myxococcaceae bacterium]|nr:glycerol-3-phosphate 1-O-acyltransferase PlsY [Myxococcaceae bacterium]
MDIFLGVLGYLSGSVPYGLLLARKLGGVDVRGAGSGNIGATNVARVAGKKLGVLVLLLDALKGALPVWLATQMAPGEGAVHAAAGFAAFLGHVFPVWLRFKGGKGVATALGVLAVAAPGAAITALLTFVAVFALARVSSIGSLSASAAALAYGFLRPVPLTGRVLLSLLFLVLLWTHRSNIGRILRRAEGRL